MKKIAGTADVDEVSLVAYIIDGIPDSKVNKMLLYRTTTLSELKEEVKIYMRMKGGDVELSNSSSNKNQQNQAQRNTKGRNKCQNCGSFNHSSTACPDRAKGSKCFRCNEFGHIGKDCNIGKDIKCYRCGGLGHKATKCKIEMEKDVKCVNSMDMRVKAIVGSIQVLALLDTGSEVSLLRRACYDKLVQQPVLDARRITLVGLGNALEHTQGSSEIGVEIDNDVFFIVCHIVEDHVIKDDLLIGRNILDLAELSVKKKCITLKKHVCKAYEIEENDINCVEVDLFECEILNTKDINHSNGVVDNSAIEKVNQLIKNYKPDKPSKSIIKMKLELEDNAPVYTRPRRLAPVEKEFVNKQLTEWLNLGVIRHSNSNYSSPITLAKKKNGSFRLCVDYRRLNKKLIKDRYPLPLMEDAIESLHKAKIFSTLDLKNGFFHVDIEEDSVKYTSFVSPDGQYEFLKAPFGLSNSPAVFQRYVNTVFKQLIRDKIVWIYVDDIIVPAETVDENLWKLKLVFNEAQRFGLEFNFEKCQFLRETIGFLGHILGGGLIKPSVEKTKAVKNFPKPRNVKEVQSFLGLAGFFRKFIEGFALIAKPLSDLTKKDTVFTFGHSQEKAYNELKEKLCSDPTLKLYNPEAYTELHTDASKFGYGAILMQKDSNDNMLHPIYYLSYKTSTAEQNYSSYDLEVLAIVKALKKFRTYLLGLQFVVVTDCKAFQQTMKKKDICARVARWAQILEEFNCDVQHRSAQKMKHVDALSRNPVTFLIEDGILFSIKRLQKDDKNCQLICKILEKEEYEDYYLRNEVLFKFSNGDYILVVPKAMENTLIRQVHEKGHCNARKVETIIKQEYYIEKLAKKVKNVIENCIPCILSNRKSGKQEGFLNPIEKIDVPLHTYHVDHLGPLPATSKNYKYLFVVIDAFTKFCWLHPTKTTNSEETIRKLEQQHETFGHPHRIISDKGAAFVSNAFKEYCITNNITHVFTTTGVPRGNGQVERLNRSIIPILTKKSIENPLHWFKHTVGVQLTLNSISSRATRMTPFELLIGVRMHTKEDIQLAELLEEAIREDHVETRKEMRRVAKENILKIQAENRSTYNKKRKAAIQYKINDLVAIQRTQFGAGLKLHPKFLGPYKIIEAKRNNRYKIKKVGDHEGPNVTTSAADYMKHWSNSYVDDSEEDGAVSSETDRLSEGPSVGTNPH